MSAVSAPTWPGSRVLLGWWRELAGRRPQQLRISRLLLHRVEALVRVSRPSPLDRWQRALLHLASTRLPQADLFASLNDLHLDPQLLGRFVRELTETGLLHRNGSGLWQITPRGRSALESGSLPVSREVRRTFVFVDRSAQGGPPHFLPLQRPLPLAASVPDPEVTGAPFVISALEACIRHTAEWKARHHFPLDVEALVPPRPDDSPVANRECVLFDTVESRVFVFIRTLSASGVVDTSAFLVRPEGWTLEAEPLLTLAESEEEVLPELVVEPAPELWRQAWQAWSHPRGLPPADVEACRLERVDHRLLVHAPSRLIERLRAARSDAVKQEAWLLAGEGRTRTAALIDLHAL